MAGAGLRQLIAAGLVSNRIITTAVTTGLLGAAAGMPQTAHAQAAEQSECVILLHGLARTARSMWKLRDALEQNYQIVSCNYPSRKHPIEELAKLAIEPSLEDCGQSGKVHFVTHSLGGILVRQYLNDTKLDKLGRVVMLGPPNQGSELVDFFDNYVIYKNVNGPAGTQLGTDPQSVPNQLGAVDFDLGVIAGNQSNNPIYSRIIGDQNDGKVSVERSKVEGMRDHLVLPVTHTFMMRDSSVIKQVEHYLQFGSFERAEAVGTEHTSTPASIY